MRFLGFLLVFLIGGVVGFFVGSFGGAGVGALASTCDLIYTGVSNGSLTQEASNGLLRSQIDKVEAVDPLTVRLLLKAPFSPLIAQLTDRAGMMVSPKAVKEAGDKFVNKPVCAGPFKFADRVVQDHITLERFADYWDKDRIHFDRVTYRPIPDSTVRLANLRAGALDLIERVYATDIPAARAAKTIDATGKLVTPGLIDLHSHVYPYGSAIGIPADELAQFQCTTTLVSAGDAGANNLAALRRYIVAQSRARIYAFVHIANNGL